MTRYPRRSLVLEDLYDRLDKAVHDLYLLCEGELAEDADDAEFIDLHNLRVECDPLCNRLVRAIRAHQALHPEAAWPSVPQADEQRMAS